MLTLLLNPGRTRVLVSSRHTRSDVAVPSVTSVCSGRQEVQAEQLNAFAVVLNEPAAQLEQARSVVLEPIAKTYCPAEHDVHDVHEVAALPSWSHVPIGHATFAVASPAQYVPGSHAAHVGGDVAVPATVCSVPGAHVPWGMHAL